MVSSTTAVGCSDRLSDSKLTSFELELNGSGVNRRGSSIFPSEAEEHHRSFLLIREVQRSKDNHVALAPLFRRIFLSF
jgi:hypothetical protein